MCKAKGLENTLLDNCVFDVLMTNDTSFADQQSLEIGMKKTIILIKFPPCITD